MAHENQWQTTTLKELEDGEVFRFLNEQPCLSAAKSEKYLLLHKVNGLVYRYINGETIGVFNESESVSKWLGSESELPELIR